MNEIDPPTGMLGFLGTSVKLTNDDRIYKVIAVYQAARQLSIQHEQIHRRINIDRIEKVYA